MLSRVIAKQTTIPPPPHPADIFLNHGPPSQLFAGCCIQAGVLTFVRKLCRKPLVCWKFWVLECCCLRISISCSAEVSKDLQPILHPSLASALSPLSPANPSTAALQGRLTTTAGAAYYSQSRTVLLAPSFICLMSFVCSFIVLFCH